MRYIPCTVLILLEGEKKFPYELFNDGFNVWHTKELLLLDALTKHICVDAAIFKL